MKRRIISFMLSLFFLYLSGCAVRIPEIEKQNTTQPVFQPTEQPATEPEQTEKDALEEIAPSIVEIQAKGVGVERSGMGAFINANGNIITNYHIIEGCYSISVKTHNGRTSQAHTVFGFNKDIDLAILGTNFANVTPIRLRAENVTVGQKIFVAGNASLGTDCFIEGTVSAEEREDFGQEFLQISAPITNSNSGSAVVDENGMMVGITTVKPNTGDDVNLVIPVSEFNNVNVETNYAVLTFFELTKGDQQLQELGQFKSLTKLQEETKRNPKKFEDPVIVSIKGVVVRDISDRIFLIEQKSDGEFDSSYLLWQIKEGKPISSVNVNNIRIVMKDDTANRVITGDVVVITGTYFHDICMIANATHNIVGSILEQN